MLCDRVIIIDHGRIIAEGSPADLRGSMGIDSVLSIRSRRPLSSADLLTLRGISGVMSLYSSNGCLSIHLREKEGLDEIVVTASRLAGIEELNLKEPSLEDVFLQLTGRGLRE